MKNDTGATTAANSKILNAVEKEKLYAAAGAVDPEVNRTALNEQTPEDWSAPKVTKKKKKAPGKAGS